MVGMQEFSGVFLRSISTQPFSYSLQVTNVVYIYIFSVPIGRTGTLLRWKSEAIFRTIHFSLTVKLFSYIESFHNPLIMLLNWVSYNNMTSLVHFDYKFLTTETNSKA